MKSKHIGKDRLNTEMGKLYLNSIDKKRGAEPGESVVLQVTSIQDPEFIFVKSQFGDGLIQRSQLVDSDGIVTVNPGEQIEAFFLEEKNGERIFTIHPIGAIARTILLKAYQNRSILTGKVNSAIKGGFEIQIGDETAFCPNSQMEGEPEKGTILKFIVIEPPHRNIVVSHKQYLEEEKKRHKEILAANLEVGAIVQGPITSLRDFGAFVDIGGGIEGLIPVSEISYKRINHPSELLKNGENVRVKVLAANWKENRITLSLKELQQNPWQGALPFQPGDLLTVEVESIRPFGVFVKLPDGFRGLIPVSESGVARATPIDREFKIGQEVKAVIMEINRNDQKISLSIKRANEKLDRVEFEQYMAGKESNAETENVSSFGQALMKSLNKKK